MIHHNIPKILNEYMTLLQILNYKDCTMRKKICWPRGFSTPFQSGNTCISGSTLSKSFTSNTLVIITTLKPKQQNVGNPMNLSIQHKNSFISKPEMNWHYTKKLYLGCEETEHFLAYYSIWRLSNKTVQRNSGQLFGMPIPENIFIETENDMSLRIVALKDN